MRIRRWYDKALGLKAVISPKTVFQILEFRQDVQIVRLPPNHDGKHFVVSPRRSTAVRKRSLGRLFESVCKVADVLDVIARSADVMRDRLRSWPLLGRIRQAHQRSAGHGPWWRRMGRIVGISLRRRRVRRMIDIVMSAVLGTVVVGVVIRRVIRVLVRIWRVRRVGVRVVSVAAHTGALCRRRSRRTVARVQRPRLKRDERGRSLLLRLLWLLLLLLLLLLLRRRCRPLRYDICWWWWWWCGCRCGGIPGLI
jgi:hypothetical protein